jgi:uncharacterized protein (TIGR02679 family)
MPPSLRSYLRAASLEGLWLVLRKRLEQNGHAIRGSVTVQLDDDGADRLSGLLGRPVSGGTARVRLADLDASFRSNAAERGLVLVVADLTGGPLRNLPAEREALRSGRELLWAGLDGLLADHGLADAEWAARWADWLRTSGAVTRIPRTSTTAVMTISIEVLHRVLTDHPPVGLAELASEITGNAHGLDDGSAAAALVLRAVAYALGVPPAASAGERRDLWRRVGVSTDEVSGTVITWALRPPGDDRWAAMMRERADLGLVTHLTVHELNRSAELTSPGQIIHACENPQVLQYLAAAGVDRPVACLSGNPAAAGIALLARAAASLTTVRYHGDFDWPGIAIARRVFERGARPWRFGRADYLAAVERLPADHRLGLTGGAEATPWDETLSSAMTSAGIAVHEESIMDQLVDDLR